MTAQPSFIIVGGGLAGAMAAQTLREEARRSTPAARTGTTASGGRLGYDKLLLTTGSTPRRLSVPGADLHGVHDLRSVDDSFVTPAVSA